MKAKITKILAALMAVIMVLSFAACGGDNNDETTTTNPDVTVNANGEESDDPSKTDDKTTEGGSSDATDPGTTDPATDPTSSTKKDDKTTDPTSSTKKDDKTTDPTSTTKKDDKTTNPTGTTTPATKTPTTTAEILKVYKDAVAKVNSSKAGFTKTRSSTASKFEVPGVFSLFEGLIKGFMGIGSDNAYSVTVNKGSFGGKIKADKNGKDQTYYYLTNVKLSESDIKNATCTKSGDEYTITITLKDGTSKAGKGVSTKNSSPLDKSGVCVGDRDIDIFDHKTAEIMYSAIEGTASDTVIDEKTNNVKIVAKVKASTGKLTNLTITFGLECKMVVKYLFTTSNITAKGTTTVTYKNFKW